MARMVVIADDFTGALDTGIQFAKTGIQTQITLDYAVAQSDRDSDVQVEVINSETRHLSAEEAGKKIYQIVLSARDRGIDIVYKKTDSAMRGNIGSELTAQLAAGGQNMLVYIPAFPKAGRTTLNGIQYVNSVPVSESVFGQDPFEPVASSFIPDIIASQSDIPVKIITREDRDKDLTALGQPAIYVFDAEKDEDLKRIADKLKRMNVNSLAGCAGFAEFLPALLKEDYKETVEIRGNYGMIVISGSINPITIRQIRRAREAGVPCFTLNRDQKMNRHYADDGETCSFVSKLRDVYRKERQMIIEAADSSDVGEGKSEEPFSLNKSNSRLEPQARQLVAGNVAEIVYAMVGDGIRGLYVFIGGDTMAAVMNRLGCKRIVPLKELKPGIVLSKAYCLAGEMMVISKSGGFGDEDALVKLLFEAKRRREERDRNQGCLDIQIGRKENEAMEESYATG